MHGKTSAILHDGQGIFAGLPSPFQATRYHSLIVEEPVPDCLAVTARADTGEVMGVQHRQHPTFGVQFHPESILTECGKDLLRNFLQSTSLRSAERSVFHAAASDLTGSPATRHSETGLGPARPSGAGLEVHSC
jgi:GMP synthase-like glutamine amidotransferase